MHAAKNACANPHGCNDCWVHRRRISYTVVAAVRRSDARARYGAEEERPTRKYHRTRRILSLGLVATLAGAAGVQPAVAQGAPPVFSPTARTAWVGIGIGALLPVPGSPKPIGQDPAHPYISND